MQFRRLLIIVAALVLAAVPVLAQDAATNSVSFNGVSFQFDSSLAANVSIQTFAGDPTDLEQPGGPRVAHTEFALYNNAVETETEFGEMDVVGFIQVYNVADFAGYEMASPQLANLQALLADRPDLGLNMVAAEDNSADLPFMPVFPGAQIVRGQAHYLDTPALSGVAYLTAHRFDVSPLTANEFNYTFQGLSADGSTYVAAVFPVTISAFPTEIPEDFDWDAFNAGWMDYLTESIALLNNAAPDVVTPQIATLDALVQTITLPGGEVAPPSEGVDVIPTEDAGDGEDGSLGGLAGTWRLVQYGDPTAPTAVLEGSEVTAIFDSDGIGGNAGCNTYGGSFAFDGPTLTIGPVVSTLMACADEAVMAQETAYLSALDSVTGYEIGDAALRLIYPEGVLVFQAA